MTFSSLCGPWLKGGILKCIQQELRLEGVMFTPAEEARTEHATCAAVT